jgi:hydrogenase maturation protease
MLGNTKILILGLGNTLLSDDGVGVHAVKRLEHRLDGRRDVVCVEGGTLGLSLLPEFDETSGFIAVDAAELGAPPGTLKLFENEAMDEQLAGKKRTAHEVALSDLMDTAALTGTKPANYALIAIQPETTEWGDWPSAAVAAALPQAEQTALELIKRWAS